MTSDAGLEQERALFTRCIDHPASEWERLLETECDDPAVRARVRRLLQHHRETLTQESAFLRLDGNDPARIGPYRILQRLGEGGMGIVYAAEQREPVRRRVAIKVLRAGYNSREVLARFEVERQALALMNHVNIARILDAGTTADHRPYIVMEYVPGEAITRYCTQRQLPLRMRLSLFRAVCDAVHHAHQKGVIHRDLKPSNILVMEEDGRPVPKVIDFGIAKASTMRLTDRTLETKAGSLLGTPDYMSPEQAELSPLDVDTRADVYALGAVLYQLLAGVPPLQLSGSGRSYAEIQRIVAEQVPLPPSQRITGALRRQVRGELDWITLKALEKQRALRYASAAELAMDVRSHLANETVIAGPPNRMRKAGKFMRRHWLASASTLAVVITLAVSQMLLVQKNRELQAERDRANVAAATSESVTTFLTDIFNATDPRNLDARIITARELLDRGRERMEAETSLPDLVRLRLVYSLAEAYRNLGYVEDAIPLYRQAQSLLPFGATRDSKLEFRILTSLGRALYYARRPADAREPLQYAIRLAKDNPAIPYEDTFDVRTTIANVELDLGNFSRAQSLAVADFQEARARFGLKSKITLAFGQNLLYIQCMTAQFAAVRQLADTLLPIAQTIGDDNDIISLQGTLGIMYTALNRLDQAERVYRPLYEQMLARLGPDSLYVQRITHLYAVTLSDTERGLRMLENLEERLRRQRGNDTLLLAEVWDNLALVHLRVPGHEAQAERYLEQARTMAEHAYGPGHMTTRGIYASLAKLHARRGREESALMFLRKMGDAPVFQFMVARDKDFAALRNDPEFIALLGRFGDDEPENN